MRYKTVIWDFNGTIFDDVDACIKSVNTLLQRRGMMTLNSRDDYYKVFGFPIIEYYRRLGFDFEKEPYQVIADEWVTEYLINQCFSTLCEGVYDTLSLMKANNVKQYVISMTEIAMLRNQLAELGIIGFFDGVEGLDNVRAYSKIALAKEWSKGRDLSGTVIVGDSVHDFEVAKALGVECVLVACGHMTRETLEVCDCEVFDSVNEWRNTLC